MLPDTHVGECMGRRWSGGFAGPSEGTGRSIPGSKPNKQLGVVWVTLDLRADPIGPDRRSGRHPERSSDEARSPTR